LIVSASGPSNANIGLANAIRRISNMDVDVPAEVHTVAIVHKDHPLTNPVDDSPAGHVQSVIVEGDPDKFGVGTPYALLKAADVARDTIETEVHPVLDAAADSSKTTTDALSGLTSLVSKQAARKVQTVGEYAADKVRALRSTLNVGLGAGTASSSAKIPPSAEERLLKTSNMNELKLRPLGKKLNQSSIVRSFQARKRRIMGGDARNAPLLGKRDRSAYHDAFGRIKTRKLNQAGTREFIHSI